MLRGGRDGCGRSAGRARRRASAGRPARAACGPAARRPAGRRRRSTSVCEGRAFLSLPAAPGPAAPRGGPCIARSQKFHTVRQPAPQRIDVAFPVGEHGDPLGPPLRKHRGAGLRGFQPAPGFLLLQRPFAMRHRDRAFAGPDVSGHRPEEAAGCGIDRDHGVEQQPVAFALARPCPDPAAARDASGSRSRWCPGSPERGSPPPPPPSDRSSLRSGAPPSPGDCQENGQKPLPLAIVLAERQQRHARGSNHRRPAGPPLFLKARVPEPTSKRHLGPNHGDTPSLPKCHEQKSCKLDPRRYPQVWNPSHSAAQKMCTNPSFLGQGGFSMTPDLAASASSSSAVRRGSVPAASRAVSPAFGASVYVHHHEGSAEAAELLRARSRPPPGTPPSGAADLSVGARAPPPPSSTGGGRRWAALDILVGTTPGAWSRADHLQRSTTRMSSGVRPQLTTADPRLPRRRATSGVPRAAGRSSPSRRSRGATAGSTGSSIYSGAKAFVATFTRALAKELAATASG